MISKHDEVIDQVIKELEPMLRKAMLDVFVSGFDCACEIHRKKHGVRVVRSNRPPEAGFSTNRPPENRESDGWIVGDDGEWRKHDWTAYLPNKPKGPL